MSIQWRSDLGPNIALLHRKFHTFMAFQFEFYKGSVESHAKINAPWTDRTTNARNGLFAVTDNHPPNYSIVLSHTQTYGIWLEVKNSGEFAIILPTIRRKGNELMRSLSGALGKLG